MTKTYNSIDIAKFFFCICIICLHTQIFSFLPSLPLFLLTKAVFRLAVPFFFVCSGFFLGCKLFRESTDAYWGTVKKYCLRLATPLLIFGVINCIIAYVSNDAEDTAPLKNVADIIRHIIFYPYGALWFLQASLIGALLLYPLLKKNMLGFGLCLGFLLYIPALICNNYYFVTVGSDVQDAVNLYVKYFISARNGLFVGFFMITLGVWTSKIFLKYQDRIKSTPLLALTAIAGESTFWK